MKAAYNKTVVTFAGVALVVPFVAVAILVGTRAVAGVEGSEQGLLLAGVAFCGALFGCAGGYSRERAGVAREARALHITAGARRGRKALM